MPLPAKNIFYPRCWASLFLAGLALPSAAQDQGSVESPALLTPTASVLKLSNETLTLPGSEKLGMLGGEMLFDVGDKLRLGGGAYGAVRGARGGFITLGAAAELRRRITPSWVGHAGLYAGAGGGRGSNALTGGGLMLRGDVGMSYETGRYGNLGVGISHTNFPSGLIRSTQPYVQYEYPFHTLLGQGWNAAPSTRSAAWPDAAAGYRVVRAEAYEFALVGRTYTIPAKVVQDNGLPQHASMHLLGIEWLSYQDDHWFLKLESEGALGGQSNGYMQILAGGGYRLAVSSGTAIKLHAAAGPAGGGQVDSGGGLLLDAGIALQQQIARRMSMELSLGAVRAPSASFQARSAGLKLNYQFGLPELAASPVRLDALKEFEPRHLRLRLASQTYLKADPQWRGSFAERPVSNLGVQLDYFVSPQIYLTGQGLAAYAGQAGGYMTGQVGMGRQWPLSADWSVEAEALLGAAGGGGLAVGGGLVGQANGNIVYRMSDAWSLLGTVGRVESPRGNFKANVVGISLGCKLSGYAQR